MTEWVLTCLAKQREARPDAAHLVLDQLRALNTGEWTSAQATACWAARVEKPRLQPRESLELAHTLAIAGRGERRVRAER